MIKSPSFRERYLFADGDPKLFIYLFSFCRAFSQLGIYYFIWKTGSYWLLPYSLFVSFYILLYSSFGLRAKKFDLAQHQEDVNNNQWFPDVDVFIPNCGETVETILNTVNAALNLKYPGHYTVYCMDDADNLELKVSLPKSDKLVYLSRPEKTGKKGGNICYTFEQSKSPFILILDADFAVSDRFLTETIHYFKQSDLGILQTPQYFRIEEQDSPIGKGAAFCQELFYRMIQVARNSVGSATCAGSNVIYRREALEKYGGTAIVPAAEDRHTAWKLQKDSWKIKYIPVILAAGECPTTINALFTQAFRWAWGATSQITSKEYWQQCPLVHPYSNFTLFNWLAFGVSGLSFSAESVGLIFGMLPIIWMYAFHPEIVNWKNSFIFLPTFLWIRLAIPFITKSQWSVGVLYAGVVSCYAYLFGVIDALRGQSFVWIPTGNQQATSKAVIVKRFRFIYPFWTTLQFSLVLGFAMNNIQNGYPIRHFIVGTTLSSLSFFTMISLFVWERLDKKPG